MSHEHQCRTSSCIQPFAVHGKKHATCLRGATWCCNSPPIRCFLARCFVRTTLESIHARARFPTFAALTTSRACSFVQEKPSVRTVHGSAPESGTESRAPSRRHARRPASTRRATTRKQKPRRAQRPAPGWPWRRPGTCQVASRLLFLQVRRTCL